MRATRSARSFALHTGHVQMWPHDRTPCQLVDQAPGLPEATRNAQVSCGITTDTPHSLSRRFVVIGLSRARSA